MILQTDRIEWLDLLKAYAIILVVMGHIVQYIARPLDFDSSIVFSVIYSFHMPLFMFISGFLTFSENAKGIDWIVKRCKSLVVPFVIWTFVNYLIRYLGTTISLSAYIKEVVKSPDMSFWFIWVLFMADVVLFVDLYVIDYLTKKCSIRKGIIRALVFFASVCVVILISRKVSILGIDLLAWHITFFLSGTLYKNLLSVTKKEEIIKSVIGKMGVIILTIALILCWRRIDTPIFVGTILPKGILTTKIICKLYQYITPILGIAASIMIIRMVPSNISRKISVIGLYTLEIYLMHEYLINSYTGILAIDCILSFALSMIIPITISCLFKGTVLKRLLFGRT